MGNYIIKPDKDKNFYVLWSTVVDMPILWGKKKFFKKKAKKRKWVFRLGENFTDRMLRADTFGTSDLVGSYGWHTDFEIDYAGEGYILRSEIIPLMELVAKHKDDWMHPDVLALVHKYND